MGDKFHLIFNGTMSSCFLLVFFITVQNGQGQIGNSCNDKFQ
jgi:hypothetical protein